MQNYSIMPLNEKHIDEICEDIRNQYENGVTTCALFQMTLVPEGTPVVDKVSSFVEKYKRFKSRLDAMGVKNGVLVQATIGHGRKLNELAPFTKYEGIVPGTEADTYCPYDDEFCDHMREVFATIAKAKPAAIMVDDDFRLMGRRGSGCACTLCDASLDPSEELDDGLQSGVCPRTALDVCKAESEVGSEDV